jgi:hypothetical protein
MSPRLRAVLLVGCLGLCALGAPGAGSILARGPDAALDRAGAKPGRDSARVGNEASSGIHGVPMRAALLAAARIARG